MFREKESFLMENKKGNSLTKKEIRNSILQLRREIPFSIRKAADTAITEKIVNTPEFTNAKTIFVYMDFNQEVATDEIIKVALEQGKIVGAPRISGGQMNFFVIEGESDLEPCLYGMMEPGTKCPLVSLADLIIVPGIAFDKNKHRIGYGGGYYDKFLAKHPKVPTIAVAYEMQILKAVPYEKTDISPDVIFTEKRIIF